MRPLVAFVVLAAVVGPIAPAAVASSPITTPGPPAAQPASPSPAVQPAASSPTPATTDPANATPSKAAIVAVYPNPVPDGDRGEYVVVETPPSAGWRLTDGETTVRIPGGTDRVVVTATPAAVNVSGRVVAAPDLRLANGGDRLRLFHGDAVVDAVRYGRAPESEVLRPGEGGWQPRGATDFGPATTGPAPVEAFVLPDAPGVPIETIGDARERVLLAGYTLSSWRVARALVAARERGVTVRVLLEGGPVGGISRRAARVVDWLVDHGVAVAVVDGPRARYVYHHPKYAVVDDRALVLTENFKPSGTGGRSNRGWGVVVHDAGTASTLAAVFDADAGWQDTRPWRHFRANRTFHESAPANGSYPSRLRPRRVRAERVRVVAAPDNAERVLLETIRDAEQSLLVQQASVGGRRQPFLQATLAAARRGVRVRLLLSSAWYVEDDNRALVEWLNGVADRENLPLRARLAEPRSRYGTVHAKGVVVDGDTAVVGSLNWNNHSARENREVAVVLEGEAVGRYYARAFRADWRGGTRRLPLGTAGAVVLAAAGGAAAVRRVSFERR